LYQLSNCKIFFSKTRKNVLTKNGSSSKKITLVFLKMFMDVKLEKKTNGQCLEKMVRDLRKWFADSKKICSCV
jgi:hypothetical protein